MPRRKDLPETVRHDGDLCATFVNSGTPTRKSISTYGELLAWGQRNGALGDGDAERLARAAAARPEEAEAALRKTEETRAVLERILLALVEHRRPADADMRAFNEALGAALANRRMVPSENGYRWGWGDRGGDDGDRVLWPVLLSAGELFASRYCGKLLRCPGEGCGLFLVDRSQGSARKWCRLCGNRARSDKHYHTYVKPKNARRKAQLEAEAPARRRAMREAFVEALKKTD